MRGITCSDCCAKTENKCNRSCLLKVMSSLESFLINSSIVETRMREYRGNLKMDSRQFLMCGVKIQNGDIGYILCKTDAVFIIPQSIKIYGGTLNPEVAMSEYLFEKYDNLDSEQLNGLVSLMKSYISDINVAKKVIVPVNWNDTIECYDEEKGEWVKSRITTLTVKRDPKTSRICGYIIARDSYDVKHSVMFRDFEKTWRFENIQTGCKEMKPEWVEMTDIGYIKPIELKHQMERFIVDNKYIYYEGALGMKAIGEFDFNSSSYSIYETVENSVIYKEIENSLRYLSKIRRSIGVYGVHETKVVEV